MCFGGVKTENFLEHYRAQFLEALMEQKLFGYLLVIWGAYFIVSDIQDVFSLSLLPIDGYWGTIYTVVTIILSLIFLVIAVLLVLLGRKVLKNKASISAKQKLLGYFVVLYGAVFYVIVFTNVLPIHGFWGTANTDMGIVVNLIFLPIALVLVLLGRKVLENKTDISAKQKLLGYFLILWGLMFSVSAIQAGFSYLHEGTAYTGVSIILSLIFIGLTALLVLLGHKVLKNKASISAKQKLLGYFVVLYGAYFSFEALLNVMPISGYWGTTNLGLSIIEDLELLAAAVVLLLLGRKVLENKADISAKQSRPKASCLVPKLS